MYFIQTFETETDENLEAVGPFADMEAAKDWIAVHDEQAEANGISFEIVPMDDPGEWTVGA